MLYVIDALYYFSLAVLGILAVSYSIATGFIGRVRECVETEQDTLRAKYQARLAKIQQDLTKPATLTDTSLEGAVKQLKAEKKSLIGELKRLDSANRAVTVSKAVYAPGGLAIGGACLAVVAKTADNFWAQRLLVALACILITVSVYQLCCRLADFQYLGTLLTPLVHAEPEYSETWEAARHNKVTVRVMLRRGSALRSLQTVLYLPPAFASTAELDSKLRRPSSDPLMPDYNVICSREWQILKQDLPFVYDYDRLSCSTPGTYALYCRVISVEHATKYIPINITVL
ncbi:MAG: hypothetical protein M9913_16160 [Bryobacteraceae bacterium]|nr:hypothetical protein [Solibacteraceae bacterium]MCO5352408.1 hypothetical protein [Bryobacteraceae bacterium]